MTEIKATRRQQARGRQADGAPNPIDVHVGKRIKLRRALLGMSQEELAAKLGITFQQIQKYEKGNNRVGASRLYDMVNALDAPVSFFYDDIPEDACTFSPMTLSGTKPVAVHSEGDAIARKETQELLSVYYAISDPKVRKSIYEMAKALGRIPRKKQAKATT